jgi:hypothetical protein
MIRPIEHVLPGTTFVTLVSLPVRRLTFPGAVTGGFALSTLHQWPWPKLVRCSTTAKMRSRSASPSKKWDTHNRPPTSVATTVRQLALPMTRLKYDDPKASTCIFLAPRSRSSETIQILLRQRRRQPGRPSSCRILLLSRTIVFVDLSTISLFNDVLFVTDAVHVCSCPTRPPTHASGSPTIPAC